MDKRVRIVKRYRPAAAGAALSLPAATRVSGAPGCPRRPDLPAGTAAGGVVLVGRLWWGRKVVRVG